MNLTPLKTLAEETIRQCTFTQPVTTPHGQREMALLLPYVAFMDLEEE